MKQEELNEILKLHKKWLNGNGSGIKANLHSADLSYADLRSADLHSADLSYADLRSANLHSADLSYADLHSADLSYANLSYADLHSADLRYAIFSITNLLRINWTDLSNELTLELMAHDAESCGIEAMNSWASGGVCPFINSERDFYFVEKREVWSNATPEQKMPKLRGRKLLEALTQEKTIKL